MPEGPVIDLRSDTLTQPTPEMRRAMAEAEVGDDSRGDCSITKRLESLAAELTGHEAGLFVTSGTMGNLVALLTHLNPGDEVIAERDSHFLRFEAGGCTALAGVIPRTLAGYSGCMDLEELKAEIQDGSSHRPRTSLIVAENTHNAAGGVCLNVSYMEQLCALARDHNLPIHLDGERIFNAAIALGVPVKRLTIGCHSVMFGLSKGLSAPYGSLLCGSREFISRARRKRQLVGGGVRQIGHMAAAGIVALETMIDRLAEDHANAKRLAQGIYHLNPALIEFDLVQTNIVLISTAPLGISAIALVEELLRIGVRALPMSHNQVRFVTYRGINERHIDRALNAMAPLLTGGT